MFMQGPMVYKVLHLLCLFFFFFFDDLDVNPLFHSNIIHRKTWKLFKVQTLFSLLSLDYFFNINYSSAVLLYLISVTQVVKTLFRKY